MDGFTSAGAFYSRPNPQSIGSQPANEAPRDGGEFERTPELPRGRVVPPAYNMRFDEAGRDTFAPGTGNEVIEPEVLPPAPQQSMLPLLAAAAFVAFLIYKERA